MDEVVVSAAGFLVIRLLGQEQERRSKRNYLKKADGGWSGNLQWK
jgi:hypothetical protein